MKKLLSLSMLIISISLSNAQTILTQWNFNSNPPDVSTSTGSTAPSIGSGTLALTGGTTATFASGSVGNLSSDPATTDNTAYNTTGYPAAMAGNGTAGIVFSVNTVGFTGISVIFDTRHSNSSSKHVSFEYSSTGTGGPWTNAAYFTADLGGDTWYNTRTVDLSGVSALGNNANAAFRVVTVFENTAIGSGVSAYVASTTTSTYATTGTLRYDMVTVRYASALPVSLVEFNAQSTGKEAMLRFITATEKNNDRFEIERSTDGRTYEQIGTVKGAGNSNTTQTYTFEDKAPNAGTNYYRLRQVDFDGQFAHSPVRSVVFGSTKNIVLFPTPVTESMNVQLDQPYADDAQWQVLDMTGRVVSEGVFAAEQVQFAIPVATLTEGAYVLRITAGNEVVAKQFRK